MTDEKLAEAGKLKNLIKTKESELAHAKTSVTVTYYREGYHSIIGISKELRDMIQVLVVASLEKELKELQVKYATL
jgi:hypothetical protein